jgi:hypothetical protein
MFDERAFLAEVEAAEPERFARLLVAANRDEETALRIHLGDARFERLRELAARRDVRSQQPKRGNVVVLHGIMGAELSSIDRRGDRDKVWVNVVRMAVGALERLWLADNGKQPRDERWNVLPTGIMKRYYGEQLLHLSRNWNVRAFWYDWRCDLRLAADRLAAEIDGWFGRGVPVHLVAHSMGGLVGRSFIQRHRQRWEGMWDDAGDGRDGGRLVMLGTPNYGSFAVPQMVCGLEPMVRKLATLDLRHDLGELLGILRSFPGSYQMLPSPSKMPDMDPLYREETWTRHGRVRQAHLDDARSFHQELAPIIESDRMIYVAGYNRRTYCGLRDLRVGDAAAYEVTLAGDGRVPHRLGLLAGVPSYYVNEDHGALPENPEVLRAVDELLSGGRTDVLPTRVPALPRAMRGTALEQATGEDRERLERELEALRLYLHQAQARRGAAATPLYGVAERHAEEIVLRGWIGTAQLDVDLPVAPAPPRAAQKPAQRVLLNVALVEGEIQATDDVLSLNPPDAVAVGHYVNVRPQFAELALDRAITAAMEAAASPGSIPGHELLLTGFTQRGTLRGELGQPFLLPDPRREGRLIAVAGMGLPGRFGAPELSVLVRELAWALGRLGKRHLATVLIGSGTANLDVSEAVAAWMRGLQYALAAAEMKAGRRIERITFIERDPARVIEIDRAIRQQDRWLDLGSALDIAYEPLTAGRVAELQEAAVRERLARAAEGPERELQPEPTRITLSLERKDERAVFRFGGITRTASVPEREVPLDPTLVDEANDELPAMEDLAQQLRRGQYLERLLVPRDLRTALASSEPLVMMVDAAAARVHWEMLAQPEVVPSLPGTPPVDVEGCFLGTGRGLTRQLRTGFAPMPEASLPTHRPLRVLVVADPAEDDPLPGAQQEGYEVAELFEQFNDVYPDANRGVHVKCLIGPSRATRTAVLEELFSQPYDVLHFAGHCDYRDDDPSASGWIFGRGRRLSAHELRRIDRVPRFVFSNACESGITPDRSEKRTAALAPSFAEAFFARGIAEFVCTAWPVDDAAARRFALELYAGLLGMPALEAQAPASPIEPLPMHQAMQRARVTVARMSYGGRTWGAYQHYGDPHFRLFPAGTLLRHALDAAIDNAAPAELQQRAVPAQRRKRKTNVAQPPAEPPAGRKGTRTSKPKGRRR